jgi:hypothetical protein
MTITKSRDDSCSSFLRAKLIRKEKRSAISWIHSGLLFYSSLTKIPSNRDVVISCKERQKQTINL